MNCLINSAERFYLTIIARLLTNYPFKRYNILGSIDQHELMIIIKDLRDRSFLTNTARLLTKTILLKDITNSAECRK
jgi:hypothetical protein